MTEIFNVLLYITFPFICILATPNISKRNIWAEKIIFGIALYELLLLLIGLILGLTNQLTTSLYFNSIILTFLLLLYRAVRTEDLRVFRSQDFPLPRTWVSGENLSILMLALLLTSAFAFELAFDFLYGTRHGDGLWYHIPRVMFWMQQGGFQAWPTPVSAQIGLPVGANLILNHKMLLGLGWNGIGFVTLLLTTGAILCIYIAALDLGFSRWSAALSSILFGSFPTVGLRIWSVNSDIAAAFPVLAAYVALLRIRDLKYGLSVFFLLNGVAIACKPTVAPLALVLAGICFWQIRNKLLKLRAYFLPGAAAVLAALLAIGSYWPVYLAFSDFMGGEYSRAHKTTNISEFVHAAAMHLVHWALEPLGYLMRFKENWQIETIKTIYNAVGANFEILPDIWKPYPGQDIGYTGMATVLALPLLLTGYAARMRIKLILVLLLAYVPLSGMILPQPFFSRYNVIFLAGFALLWGGSKLFQNGIKKRILLVVVALNVCALFGAVSIKIYLDLTTWSKSGGLYHYVSNEDRDTISQGLNGRNLLVITDGELESLLVGPEMAFGFEYILCASDGDWGRTIEGLSKKSNWLAVVHNGKDHVFSGPDWDIPGHNACKNKVSTQVINKALEQHGWKLFQSENKLDFWFISVANDIASRTSI